MKSAFALTAVICLTGNVQAVKIQGTGNFPSDSTTEHHQATGTNVGDSPDPCEATCKPVENECKSQADAHKAVCKDCAKCNRDQGPGPTAGGPPAGGQCPKGEAMMNHQYNNKNGSPDCQCVTHGNACEKNMGPKGPHCIFDNFCDGGSPDPCEAECKPVENECKSFADAHKPVCASCAKCNREKGPPPSTHPCDAVCNGKGMNEQECNACNGHPGQGPPKPTAEQMKKVKEVTDWCKATPSCAKQVHAAWTQNVPVTARMGDSATAERWCATGPSCSKQVMGLYAAAHHSATARSVPTAAEADKVKAVTAWCKATEHCSKAVHREWDRNVPATQRLGDSATAERWCVTGPSCRKQVLALYVAAHHSATH